MFAWNQMLHGLQLVPHWSGRFSAVRNGHKHSDIDTRHNFSMLTSYIHALTWL